MKFIKWMLDIQVTRTKSRWKCTLKDGIMHINNKDILFNKVWAVLRLFPPPILHFFLFINLEIVSNYLGAMFFLRLQESSSSDFVGDDSDDGCSFQRKTKDIITFYILSLVYLLAEYCKIICFWEVTGWSHVNRKLYFR